MEATSSLYLRVLNTELAGTRFALGDRTVVGRSSRADIHLTEPHVSREHCQIVREGGTYVLEDLGSRLGTRVNGKPVRRGPLRPEDCITVGATRLEVCLKPAAESVIVAPAGILATEVETVHLGEVPVPQPSLTGHLDRTEAPADEVGRLRQHMDIVRAFSEQVQTTLELPTLMDRTLASLFEVFSQMDAGAFFLKDPGTDEVVYRAGRHRGGQDGPVTGISSTILRYCDRTQQAVLTLDAQADARFIDVESVQQGPMRTQMCVPLVCRGETVGFVYMLAARQAKAFSRDDLALLTSLAGPIATCIANARLAEGMRREAALRAGLERYVSPDLVEHLLAEDGVRSLMGRRREGVCLFCDLSGFTSLAERLAAQQVGDLLNRYFDRMIAIVFEHGGSVNKFGGDSLLAVWNALGSRPQAEADAITAAFLMHTALFELNRQLAADGQPALRMRIGMSAGPFFAGNIGGKQRMEFTVIGDTINIAARLQHLAHPGQILVPVPAVAGLRGRLGLVSYGAVRLRGRGKPLPVASVRCLAEKEPSGAGTVRTCLGVTVRLRNREQPNGWDGRIVSARREGGDLRICLLGPEPWSVGSEMELRCSLPELAPQAEEPVSAVVGEVAEQSEANWRHDLRIASPPGWLGKALQPGTRKATGTLRRP